MPKIRLPNMFDVILYQPEIPPNTGNVIRLCANTGVQLHLVRPLGFELDDRQLRRAGLDYHEYANLCVHENLEACLRILPGQAEHQGAIGCTARLPCPNPTPTRQEPNVSLRELMHSRRLFAFTTKGGHAYDEIRYEPGDLFLFGPESRGLPPEVLESAPCERRLRLPMLPHSRSLNLSNAVAVAVYEAWRQCGYQGAAAGIP